MALRKEKDKEHGHQKNPSDPWQKYRATVNACRKSVRQDKKAYWREMSEALTRDFRVWQAAFCIPTPQSPHGPGDYKTSQQRERQTAPMDQQLQTLLSVHASGATTSTRS